MSKFRSQHGSDDFIESRFLTRGNNSPFEERTKHRETTLHKKGLSSQVDYQQIEAELNLLLNHRNDTIKDLSGNVLTAFNNVSNHVDALYHNPVEYAKLYAMMVAVFKDIKTVYPKTVASYIIGCYKANAGDLARGCSAVCAGSAPLPNSEADDGNQSFCEYPVFLVSFTQIEGDTKPVAIFQQLNSESPNLSNKTDAIMYTSYSSLEAFPGLSQDEVDELKTMGVQNVSLRNTESSTDIAGGFTPTGKLMKAAPVTISSVNNSASVGIAVILFVILIIIIVILIVVACQFSKPVKVVTTAA